MLGGGILRDALPALARLERAGRVRSGRALVQPSWCSHESNQLAGLPVIRCP